MNPPLPESLSNTTSSLRPRSPAPSTSLTSLKPLEPSPSQRPRSPATTSLTPIQNRPRSPALHSPDSYHGNNSLISPDKLTPTLRPRTPVVEEQPFLHVFSGLRSRSPAADSHADVGHHDGKMSLTSQHLPPLPQLSHEKKLVEPEPHSSIDSFRKNAMLFEDKEGAQQSVSRRAIDNDLSSALLLTSIKSNPERPHHVSSVEEIRRARRSFTEEEAAAIRSGGSNASTSSTAASPEQQRRAGVGLLPHLDGPRVTNIGGSSSTSTNGSPGTLSGNPSASHRHGLVLDHIDASTLPQRRESKLADIPADGRHHTVLESLGESKSRSRPNSATNSPDQGRATYAADAKH